MARRGQTLWVANGFPDVDRKCIHNDDGYNYLRTTDAVKGFANAWSIAFWAKMVGSASNTANKLAISAKGAASYANAIWIGKVGAAAASTTLKVELYDSAGLEQKKHQVDGVWSWGDWRHIVVAFDGSLAAASQLTLYVDGSAPSYTPDNDGSCTMTDTARVLSCGKSIVASVSWLGCYEFRYYQTLIWDVKIDADAVTALYNSGNPQGLDPNADWGDYNYSADLGYYFPHGYDATAIGVNQVSGGGIDLTDISGLDASDIVVDSPS